MQKSVACLKTDPFKHLATLKFISLYRDHLTISLVEDAPDWALSVVIPTAVLSYDTETYPGARKAVFLNGTSSPLKNRLLDALDEDHYVLRLNEVLDLSGLAKRFQVRAGNSFLSFSCSGFDESAVTRFVPGNSRITDETIKLIGRNGYTAAEIKKYFTAGAVWFGLEVDGQMASVCFIYQNYGDIWEIAGVHTVEPERNKGYAKIVVASALNYILNRNLVPRYEADVRNTKSVNLAQSLGMKQFLRIDHFLLNP